MQNERDSHGGAVDQAAFDKVMRDNLSPEGIAMVISYLQPALGAAYANEEAKQALDQVEWFHDTLLEMLGAREFNRLQDELGM